MLTVEAVPRALSTPSWFADLFAHRRWIRRSKPFPHIYARDVFVDDFYRRLADEFERVRRERPELFRSVAKDYGATGVQLWRLPDGPLSVFLSREWHDVIAGVAGVQTTGDVEGSIHHHPPGSDFGWAHNDLNPAWFPGAAPEPGQVRLPDDSVDIKTGERAPGVVARETVRAVAVLFYLNNKPDWTLGDGGETALYEHIADGAPARPLTVAPLNNSMVIFECTPRTWHTFTGANTSNRNSVVMWLHRPKEDVVARWGGESIAYW